MKLFLTIYKRLLEPRSTSLELRRREFILTILLTSSLGLSGLGVLKNQYSLWRDTLHGVPYDGTPLYVLPWIFLGIMALFLLSRIGFIYEVSYVLIGLLYVGATATSYAWGVEVPQALVTFVLVIVMAGVLVSTRFALFMSLLISGTLLLLSSLDSFGVIHPNLTWKQELFRIDDTIALVVVFMVITVVSWLSNREIEKSLLRAQVSEARLKQERDHLEEKVQERTRDLEKVRLEKLIDLYRYAEFGRLAGGLFHDLVTPLNTVSLTLDQLHTHSSAVGLSGGQGLQAVLQRAIRGTKSMENFVESVRQQIHQKETALVFSLLEVIKQVVWMVSSRAEERRVAIEIIAPEEVVSLYGNPVKFHQLVLNLLLNAIDAYDDYSPSAAPRIVITLAVSQQEVTLTVQDWGKGIPAECLQKVFEPFFTTKPLGKGTGIGLSISREIAQVEFAGTIQAHSVVGEGSIFTVQLPIRSV